MPRTKLRANIALAGLIACVVGIYGPTLFHELIFDDRRLVDGTIFGRYGSLLTLQPRMLSYGSFVWIDALTDHNVMAQRGFNVLLHLATCWAIWQLVQELVKHADWSPRRLADPLFESRLRFAMAAGVALYAVNPVAVYAVGYLIQRSIIMATLFAALACTAYLRALARGSLLWAIGALACTLLALASKEHAVTLPLLALPLYIYVKRPSIKGVALASAVGVALLAVLTALLWQRFGAMVGASAFDETSGAYVHQLEQMHPGITARIYPLSVMNQAALFWHYGLLW